MPLTSTAATEVPVVGVQSIPVLRGHSYQLTTGTSVAAGEVSGIVALLLERNR